MKKRLMEMGIQEDMAKEAVNLFNKEMNKVKEEYKNEIYSIKLENAIETAITSSGAKTGKAVRALLDTEKISLDDNGEINGINEQLKALMESDDTKYLFNNKEEINFKGVNLGNSTNIEKNVEDMNYTELCAYLEKSE